MGTPAFDPFAPELVSCPYPAYARLRADQPIHWSEHLHLWVMTRFEDVHAVLQDLSFEAVRTGDVLVEVQRRTGRDYSSLIQFMEVVLFFKNGAEHQRDRRTLAKVMNKFPLSQLDKVARQIAAELAAPLFDTPRYDAIAAFADPLPQRMMGYILGLSESDIGTLGGLLAELTLLFDPAAITTYDRLNLKVRKALDLLKERIAADRETDSGLGMIYRSAREGSGDALEQAAASALFTYRVGAETTIGYISMLVQTLMDRPQFRDELAGSPARLERFAAEVLRMEANVQRTLRVATRARRIGGQEIAPGERVLLLIGAANRDPAAFTAPDEIFLDTKRPDDLTFGSGGHFCLGASLARLEGRIALETFLRLPAIEPDGDPQWYAGRTVRRMTALPVRIREATS